jgi:energy-coupling factor transport system ATP-binding protein
MTPATIEQTRTAPALSFEGFTYRYPDGVDLALADVSLEIPAGQFVLVCGDSGSGKSSFLRAVSGLVPHHFGGEAAGSAMICGNDLRSNDAGDLAAYCGTLLQDPETQIVMDSVRGEIAFPLENLGWEQAVIAVAVEETAAALGIGHLLKRRTDSLSGGELQRVALAAALAVRPAVLVLDEPTSQLDPVAADELLATLHRLNIDRGTTIVLADHRLERALDVADRVIVFDHGRVAIDASPQEFLEAAASDTRFAHLLPPLADMFVRARRRPLPLNAKAARAALPANDFETSEATAELPAGEVVLDLAGVGFSYRAAATPALEGIDLQLHAGERSVLMGANGSGKSTLLRLAHGVQTSAKGTIERAGDVALLLQNPNDYLIHERVADEAPIGALERFGLDGFIERDPRDLSGGERQRLALAIVTQSDPSVLLLDEPTRGMDQARKLELAQLLNAISERGTAVMVATHDAEFAALFAQRAVLLGSGKVLADGPARDVLGGGWHFSTAVANLFPGSGALTPQQGAQLLLDRDEVIA